MSRRFSTAGHALVVAALALLFGALLLAPGMHKAAFNGQPGTKRDVAPIDAFIGRAMFPQSFDVPNCW